MSVGTTVTLNGSASGDVCNDPLTYSWRFGDGGTASGAMVAHGYAHPGRYRVTLTVTSSAGRASSLTRTVRVR